MRQKDECRLWLESYRELRTEEERLWQRHQRLLSQATRITAQLKDVPVGGGGDKEQLLAALADEDGEAMAMHARAQQRRREIEEFIDTIPTPNSRIILRYRYVELMPWEKLMMALQKSGIWYERSHIFRLHGIALKEARSAWRHRKEAEHG